MYPGERGRKNKMPTMIKKYSCINCGSVFEPSLKAEFEHIKVRCPFCHYEAALVSIPEFETPEQYQQRTGEPYHDEDSVFGLCNGDWHYLNYKYAKNCPAEIMVIAPTLRSPPDDWRPE
jgi:DNA-directed RNA polymerase subunit RPC12/RpoP